MIKAVIFDLDDTLLESRAAKWAQHKHVAKKFFNIDLKEETLLKHWGKPINVLAPELYEHLDTWENIHPLLINTRKDFPKIPYQSSVETIEKLTEDGILVAIISATTKHDIEYDLEKYNFSINKFIHIQGAEDTKVHKPDPDVFLPVFKKLSDIGIKKEEMVYVGDSLDDLRASHGAGINFIAITTGIFTKEDFEKNGAKVIVSDIKEVINFLN